MSVTQYDIAVVANLANPPRSVLRQVAAQARAGYSTALVPLAHAPVVTSAGDRALAELLCRDGVDLAAPGGNLTARLGVLQDAGGRCAPSSRLRCETAVIRVADRRAAAENDTPTDSIAAEEFLVAPANPEARRRLSQDSDERLTRSNWGDPIDVDLWSVGRHPRDARTTTIGRHSDALSPDDWPATPEEILAAYPNDGRIAVRVLGEDSVVRAVLGFMPRHWTVMAPSAIDARRFLAHLDAYVYLCQAPGIAPAQRRMLEAMASGLAIVAPTGAEPFFGEACRYATPTEVPGLLAALSHGELRRLGEAAQTFAREHHSFEAHAERVRELIGPPSSARGTSPRAHTRRRGRRVAFLTSNGEGMGHLTRLMACARRLPDGVEPVFFTLSSAMAVVEEAGFPCEFIPRQGSWTARDWNPFLRRRLRDLVCEYRVGGVVFDGTAPYWGLVQAMSDLDVPFVWMRRGMWKLGVGARSLEHAGAFRLIIEPGDYAQSVDPGLTAARRQETLPVGPITLLDRSELLDRDTAIQALDLDQTKTRVLMLLGSDTLNDVASRAAILTRELLRHESVEVMFADWLISSRSVELPDRVKRRAVYPVSRYLKGFDFAVSAAGYNSYHELLQAGVPTIFTPTRKQRDDQAARAAYAERDGAALMLRDVTDPAAARSVTSMMDGERRASMAKRAQDAYPANGAQAAADAIASLVSQRVTPSRDGDGRSPLLA